ncbi:uncharacterized protein [Montipora foliosa]|uniref:uncharacterized protein isoform X1 n=1 Tax=Montipora foliosa TaxID=591990 RepID=UPI0035F11BAF
MPRRGSEVSEGTDDSNRVYGLIRDLLVEGKDAWFVNRRGRYGLNWCRALDCYADYKARKKPQFKSKNLTRQKLSNHLRSALLNFYKKDGAKEYMESKKVNNKNEVIERQFQMPSKLFKSFFGSTVPSDESEQQDEQEINSITSEDEIDHNSSDHGFDETMDQSCVDVQSTHNSSDHGFDETMDQSCVDVHSTHNSSDHGFDETMDQSCVGETNSSPQDENPLNGGPNTGTHSTTSYLCPNNASQMFPTLSDTWHQELLDSANMNIVDGQPSMEIQPEGTVHQDQVGADCNGNSPTEEFDSLTTATDLNIKSRNSSQKCDLDHSVVQRIIPPSGSVEGGYPFVIALSEPLPGQVNFGEAKFHGVATVNLEKLNNHTFSGTVPRCHLAEPGIVEVTVMMAQTGQHLGTTSFEYVDELTKIAKQITVDHGKQAKFFSKLSEEHKVLSGSSLQSKQQHSLQFLQFLIYTASQTGAKKFIEIIFSTSAGQIVFDSYKDRTCLPEDVARASGHDELANYLQDLTTRFSKEPEFSRKEAHVIDWSELEVAAIAAQTQGCLTEEKSSDDSSENNSDTDYFADVETSSIDSSELSRSTSEDDTSEPNSRDKTKASAYQSISSIGKWAFAGNGTMGKIGQIKEGMKQKSCVLILRDSHFDSSLPEVVKGLDYTLAFHLAIGSKNIPCHLHTVNERFLVLRESITRQPTMSFCKLHPYPDVLKESSLVKNNKGFISKTVASKQCHWNQLNEDIFAELGTLMPIEKDMAVEWKSSCTFGKQFGAHTHGDLWVFTSAFLPTRKTFFVYFADRRDALPLSYFFEDEDCESQVRCWKWQRSGNKSLNFTERLKEKELPPGREESHMESHADLPVTYIVRDKQAQTPSESGICLSWMHAMMHHCWTTESTEKASNIILFDHFLGLSKETECEDQPKTINWLELVKAVQNETSVSSGNESKRPGTSAENDDNTSDYFADAETSSLGSMEPNNACSSDSEEEDAANKGLKSTFGFSKPFSDDTSSNGRFLIDSASTHSPDEDFKKGLPPFYIGLLTRLVYCVFCFFFLLFEGSAGIHSPDEDFKKRLPPLYIGFLYFWLFVCEGIGYTTLYNASSEGRCHKGPECLQDNNTRSSRRRYPDRGNLLTGALVLLPGFMLGGNMWEEIDKQVSSSAVWTEIQAPGNVFVNEPAGLFQSKGWATMAEGESRIRGRPGKQWLQEDYGDTEKGLLTTVRARVETKISSLAACVNGSITLSGNDPSRFPIKDQWRQFRYPNDDWINIRDCDGYGCVTLTLLDGTRVSVGTRKSLRVECTAQNSTKDRVQFLLEAQDNSVFRLEKVPLKNVWEEIDKTVTSSAVWTEIQAPGNVFGNVPPGLFLPNGGQGQPGLLRTPGAWTNAIRVAEGESRIRGRPGKQWLQEDYGNTGPKGDAEYEGEKDLSMLEWEGGSEYSENTKLLGNLGVIRSKKTHVPVEVWFFTTASVMLVSFIASFLQRLFHQYICLGHFEKTKLSD